MKIGIIAEDVSDVRVVELLLRKMVRRQIVVRMHVGNGCARIRKKCGTWAENLSERGCRALIVVHDLDEERHGKLPVLHALLTNALRKCSIGAHVIIIPVQEIEAWLLADEKAVAKAMKLRKPFKRIPNPESIRGAKEHLERVVSRCSDRRVVYLNTVHNEKIASAIEISSLRRCSSFAPLEQFARAL